MDEQEDRTHICGDEGAVEIGVSVKAVPTPPLLGAGDVFSECKSLPSALPTTVFGGGIKEVAPSLPEPTLVVELKPLGWV